MGASISPEMPGGKQRVDGLSASLADLYLASASVRNGTTVALSGFLLSAGSRRLSLGPPTRLGGVDIQIPLMSGADPPMLAPDAFEGFELCASIAVVKPNKASRQQARQPRRRLFGKSSFLYVPRPYLRISLIKIPCHLRSVFS